jgi:hypothetical protein
MASNLNTGLQLGGCVFCFAFQKVSTCILFNVPSMDSLTSSRPVIPNLGLLSYFRLCAHPKCTTQLRAVAELNVICHCQSDGIPQAVSQIFVIERNNKRRMALIYVFLRSSF